jgi:hypothetical protein
MDGTMSHLKKLQEISTRSTNSSKTQWKLKKASLNAGSVVRVKFFHTLSKPGVAMNQVQHSRNVPTARQNGLILDDFKKKKNLINETKTKR